MTNSKLTRRTFAAALSAPLLSGAAKKRPNILFAIADDWSWPFAGVGGDKTVNGGNVLTMTILKSLPKYDGPKVIYGETCRFSPENLNPSTFCSSKHPTT